VTILEKTPVIKLFSEIGKRTVEIENHNQLSLFE